MKFNRLLCATAITGALASLSFPAAAAPAAAGQSAASGDQGSATGTAATPEASGADIVVTGSRIARPELQSATPIAVVSADTIRRQGVTNIQDTLSQLPQVGIPGLSRTNSNFLTSGNGIATINLRNLGDSRTLVLVNGRRFVPGIAGLSVVDVNDIPADFVDRIEVVTGGASAVYGSDAVAGVVNFVLKDNIQGITIRAQNGITEHGDDPTYSVSASAGTKFGADGRGSIMGNFTYDRDEGLYARDRAISAQDCYQLGCGPAAYSTYAPQGYFQLQNGGPHATGNNGFSTNLFTFDKNNNLVLGFPTGSGFNRQSIRRISTPVERYLGTLIAHYNFSPAATAYVEATYAKVHSSAEIEPYPLNADNDIGFGYKIDNPFIPVAIQQQIAARNSDADPTNNVDEIGFRRRQNDVFTRITTNDRDTFRVAGGLRGEIAGSWKYDASVVYGQLKDHTQTPDVDIRKYANALDAIRDGSGNIVCRDAAARAAGCVPINLFGFNTVSPQAAAYVAAAVPRSEDVTNTELVATLSATGHLLNLPAGPLQVSVGGEYRREKSTDLFDALTAGGFNTGNQLPNTVGQFDVKEAFGEVEVPILKNSPLGRSLSLQGAARYSDYSTIGHVFSWNVGGEYSPVNGLRFRGNYAVANRAPNIAELFSPPAETFPGNINDPCNGVTATSTGTYAAACRANPLIAAAIARNGSLTYSLADLQNINGFDGGNTALREEKGKTITAGVALSPPGIRGLSLTVDYFNIEIDNAIGTSGRANSINQCLLTNLPQFCNNVIRDTSTGFIKTVNDQNINIAKLKTTGIDADLRYGHRLGLGADDHFDLHVLYTHTFKFDTQSDPAAPVNSGVGNLEYGKVFRDKVTATATYRLRGFSVNWTANYLSNMVDTPAAEFADTVAALGVSPDVAAHNQIAARLYNDAQLSFDIGGKRNFEFFAGVKNMFDVSAPKLEDVVFNGQVTGTETAADVYDPFGRRFYAGVQVHF